MGNCFSEDVSGGARVVAGRTAAAIAASAVSADRFLKSRAAPSTRIELSLSASNLPVQGVFSKSDPIAVVFLKKKDGSLEELGRTEVVIDSLSPNWVTKVTFDYLFEIPQLLIFQIYDVDSQFHNIPEKELKLEEQLLLGEASCLLSEVVTKWNRVLSLKLDGGQQIGLERKCGEFTIHAEESTGSKTIIEMLLRCSNLESKDVFAKSDPFLVISMTSESGESVMLFKTEVKKNDLNPTWKPVIWSLQQIGSKENLLSVQCFNYNSNGKHDLIGEVVKSVAQLESLYHSKTGEHLFIHSSAGDKVPKSLIFVEKYSESQIHTFLDYISSGFELIFMAAVDFTASNGNPRLPDSLHYIDPSGRPNVYQRAILEVGDILQFYCRDKHSTAWGFGARPIDGPVSHCFNLNGSINNAKVEGIQGIMSAYVSALRHVSLAGPTLFGHVIDAASVIASQALMNNEQKYFVLLIVTDGVVTDLQETMDAIVKGSVLPLSIIIVGVGGADYKEMEILDSNKGERLESTTGRVASRDMVQFLTLRDPQASESSLVQALAELPAQFLTYVRMNNIRPACQ